MGLFQHPSVVDGSISFEDQTYPVRQGVVECPDAIGVGAHWARAAVDALPEPTPTEDEDTAADEAPAEKRKRR